jgi:IclR family transcriptional regulator, acetate operon repressor
MRSVRRAFTALEFLVAAAPNTVRVTDLAHHLDVSVATASRTLATLVEQGYGSRTAGRRFTVGPRSMQLATAWVSRVRAAAAAPASRVAEATGEIVMVSQLLGDEQVPLIWHQPKGRRGDEARVLARVATPYPLWATASGRALLGSLPPEQRPRLLPTGPFPQLTRHTLTDWTDVKDAIRTGIKDGLHLEQGEVSTGLWCCSVALEPSHADERLAIAVICVGEPSAPQQTRIHRVLRQEAFNTTVGLTNLP